MASQLKPAGAPKSIFFFIKLFNESNYYHSERQEITAQLKSMIRNLINEHLTDVDFEHPRDFIDVYLKEIHQTGDSFDIEQLVVVCLDFFEAGSETTR